MRRSTIAMLVPAIMMAAILAAIVWGAVIWQELHRPPLSRIFGRGGRGA